jgi:uncharacterized protein YcgI (DUF1989 family)
LKQGDYVDLRAEMDVIVALSNCPHPLVAGTRTGCPSDPRDCVAVAGRGRKRSLPSCERRSRACFSEHRLGGARLMSATKSSPRNPKEAVYDHVVPAREPWSGLVKKGQALRIVDLEGQQAVDTLFYAAQDFSERYCAQSTLSSQGGAYVTSGTPLISNRGPRDDDRNR